MKLDPVIENVRADLLRRSQLGIEKYGTTLYDNPLQLKQWLQHAYEETLDQANYLQCAIMSIDARMGASTFDQIADRILRDFNSSIDQLEWDVQAELHKVWKPDMEKAVSLRYDQYMGKNGWGLYGKSYKYNDGDDE